LDASGRKMRVILNYSARRRQRSARWEERRLKVRLVKIEILLTYKMVR